MELFTNLLRDLVGIIFPGAIVLLLLVLFTMGLTTSVSANLNGIYWTLTFLTENTAGLLISAALAFIAGQFLRIKTLDGIDRKATAWESWKVIGLLKSKKASNRLFRPFAIIWFLIRNTSTLPREVEIKTKKKRQELSDEYQDLQQKIGKTSSLQDSIQLRLKEIQKEIQPLERFPYPISSKIRQKLGLSDACRALFTPLEDKMDSSTFFNYCKSLLYHYKSPLREELLHAEDLVRLLAGIYYNLRMGFFLALFISILQVLSHFFDELAFNQWASTVSITFIVLALLGQAEILTRIRRRRKKEINIAYDGYFLVMTENNST